MIRGVDESDNRWFPPSALINSDLNLLIFEAIKKTVVFQGLSTHSQLSSGNVSNFGDCFLLCDLSNPNCKKDTHPRNRV